MAYGIIYLLIDATNDKEYVGQTTKTLKKRFNQHKRGDQLIDRTIQKRGEDLFTTAILNIRTDIILQRVTTKLAA